MPLGLAGKILIFVGVMCIVVGALFLLCGKFLWLGKLPGDIAIHKEKFHFYFPLATCLLISLILSSIIWIIRKFL